MPRVFYQLKKREGEGGLPLFSIKQSTFHNPFHLIPAYAFFIRRLGGNGPPVSVRQQPKEAIIFNGRWFHGRDGRFAPID